MTQVTDAPAVEAGFRADTTPRFLQVGHGLAGQGTGTDDHIWIVRVLGNAVPECAGFPRTLLPRRFPEKNKASADIG